jgi:hypothetical protein
MLETEANETKRRMLLQLIDEEEAKLKTVNRPKEAKVAVSR